MRTDKEDAFELRRQGKSYKEIHNKLGMSVSTLSNWFKGVDFSEDIKRSLVEQNYVNGRKHLEFLNKVRGDLLEAYYQQAKKEAVCDLEKNIHNPLFVSAIAAYWGEGDKASKNHIRITNTDPQMLQLFLKFLLQICKIDKARISIALFLYEDLDEEVCKRYWSKNLGFNKYHKTQILPSRHKSKKLPYGTATVVLTDSYLKKKMIVWIDQLPKMVLNMVPKR